MLQRTAWGSPLLSTGWLDAGFLNMRATWDWQELGTLWWQFFFFFNNIEEVSSLLEWIWFRILLPTQTRRLSTKYRVSDQVLAILLHNYGPKSRVWIISWGGAGMCSGCHLDTWQVWQGKTQTWWTWLRRRISGLPGLVCGYCDPDGYKWLKMDGLIGYAGVWLFYMWHLSSLLL